MNATIIGTGNMARGIATRLLAGGGGVTLVGREPGAAEELAAQLRPAAAGAEVSTASYGDPVADEVVVLAVPYAAAARIVGDYGDRLAGKTVVDITNPINWETMEPAVAPGTSGAEEIARAASPDAKVVKAFNTTFAGTLADGRVGGQPLDVFLAGDDADAKARLGRLIEASGLRPVDAGPLRRARQLEALGLLHIALQAPLDTGFASSLKVLA